MSWLWIILLMVALAALGGLMLAGAVWLGVELAL